MDGRPWAGIFPALDFQINYFGRVENVEDIRVRPILLRKGNSKVGAAPSFF